MHSLQQAPTGVLSENDAEVSRDQIRQIHSTNKNPHLPVIWSNVFKHILSHTIAAFGLFLAITSAKWLTCLWLAVNFVYGTLGSTAGVHRLWSHRSYKARWPLRLFLAYGQALNFHMDIMYWCRLHRVHHKYTETDSDPHNAKRGFIFSHVGWTYRKASKDFLEKYQTVDVSDLYQDPIAKYQEKYYFTLVMPLSCFIVPTIVPMYFWNETLLNAFCVNIFRYILNLHTFFCVNSFTHSIGSKPYDKSIEATENTFVSFIIGGEGWHNYHHVFPWDYRTSEYGSSFMNYSTAFIELMAKLGLAYDLKSVSTYLVERKAKRSGDGTRTITESILC